MKQLQKRRLSWILSLVMILNLLPLTALASEGTSAGIVTQSSDEAVSGTYGEVSWYYDSATRVLTISGEGDMADAEPLYDDFSDEATYEDIPWSALDIDTVQIESGVTGIGNGAFWNCSTLTGIYISDTVTRIGLDAFSGCTALHEISIPKSVTSISYSALRGNGLTSIQVEAGNPIYSSVDGVLFNVDQDTLLVFPSARTGSYNIPSCAVLIEVNAFDLCQLSSVTIPSTVRSIGDGAFKRSSLQSVTIQEGVLELCSSCFRQCTNLEKIVLPDSITEIPDKAFYDCENLSSVTLGSKVTAIGSRAFANCNRLKEITIPKSVTTISSEALGYIIYDKYDFQDRELMPDFTIKGYRGTAAETYAKENSITFKALDPAPVPKITSLTNDRDGVTIKWTKIDGTPQYRVYRRIGSEDWTRIGSTTSTTFTDKTVKSGTTYCYTVRGVSADGKSFTTGYDKAGKSIQYFAPPRLVSATNAASGVNIKWEKVSGAAQYRVFRKSGSGDWKRIGNTTSTSFTDKTAKSGTTYYYTVRCLSADGSSYTSSFDKTGKCVKYLAQPSISSATNTASGVTVKWDKISGASGYYVYRKTSSGSYSKIATIKKNDTVSYTDTGVKSKNGTTYLYTVRAYSGSTLSSYQSGKTIVRLSTPSVSSLQNVKSQKMTVKWSKNTKATGFQIQYATNSKFSGAKTLTVSKNSTVSATISKLTKQKTYYVRVRSYKTVSKTHYYSGWSSTKSVTIKK